MGVERESALVEGLLVEERAAGKTGLSTESQKNGVKIYRIKEYLTKEGNCLLFKDTLYEYFSHKSKCCFFSS